VLRKTLTLVLAALVSSCSASNSTDASNGNAGEADHGGWAASEAVFQARWNNLVKGVYKLSDFQGDRNSRDGAKATYLAGEVISFRGMYMNNIRDPRWFGAACGDTIAAALGVSADNADALARRTYANLEASGFGHGTLEYHGYTISMDQQRFSQTQLRSFCAVGPSDVAAKGGEGTN
jgi:hypothetical protein